MAPAAPAKPSKSHKTKPRLLVVDDEQSLVELMHDVVARSVDCRVLAARSIGEARDILAHGEIELLVTDVNLPDGDGTALISELRKTCPSAEAIVITGQPSMEGAISALRRGAIDFVPKPFNARQIVERVQQALHRQRLVARQGQRIDKLREAVRRLNEARKMVTKKVDLLCNDLISAYGELSRQLDVVRTQESFRKTLAEAKDLEQLLCHGMDWILRQVGYSNVAVWLSSDDHDFQLGAYIKYTIAGEVPLTDAMKHGLLRSTVRDGFVQVAPGEVEKLSPDERKFLANQSIISVNCTYLGESLAVITLFRDKASAFTDDDAATLRAISPIFATLLASAVRGTENEMLSDEADDEPEWRDGGTEDDEHKKKPRKPDPADWWKRGEDPPF
jgi:FixJ family two-component response regulator